MRPRRDETVLCVGRNIDGAETIARRLRRNLPELTVRTTSRGEERWASDVGDLACVVYEGADGQSNALDVLETIRSDDSGVPFLLVVPPDSDAPIDELLAAERTAVVRRRGDTVDASVLANRVEGLVERYRQETTLAQEQSRFETLLNKLTTPIVEVEFEDSEPVVTRVNRAFEEVFGYEESEIRGGSLDDYVVPPDRQDEADEINDRVLDGEVFSVEVTRRTADGQRDFLLRNAVFPDMPGEFAIYTDLTEQKRRERELQRQNERLEQFASVVSHDLRTPLTVARGRLDMAKGECDSPHLDDVERAHDRMETLIEDVLALAREGSSVTDTEPVDLGELVEDCWRLVETAGATLLTETDAVVQADRSRLQRLLENLFGNAIDHGGDTVTVGDLADGFYVQDDGPGIPEENRDRVFEPGFSTGEGGTGFGLSIAGEIAEAHGWAIRATEAPTGGARFEVTGVAFADDGNGGS